MKIGDGVYVHGYVDEIRKDTVIIRNNGGYFGTVKNEIVVPFAELATNLQQSCNQLATDCISRQAAINAIIAKLDAIDHVPQWVFDELTGAIGDLSSAQPEIIHCKECKYGVQDEDERWYCRSFGCQVGDEDGSGFCSDAERRTDED